MGWCVNNDRHDQRRDLRHVQRVQRRDSRAPALLCSCTPVLLHTCPLKRLVLPWTKESSATKLAAKDRTEADRAAQVRVRVRVRVRTGLPRCVAGHGAWQGTTYLG